MRARVALILLGCLVSGCVIGMHPSEFELARTPQGIRSTVVTSDGRFTGELLEVREAGIVLLAEDEIAAAPGVRTQRLRLIPFAAISRADFAQRGALQLSDGNQPSARVIQRLRLVSRFPYGMSPAIERDLLKAFGQDTLAGVGR